MNYTVDENGITISKLFKKTRVSYSEIRSIINKDDYSYINTRYGETYKFREEGDILGTYMFIQEAYPDIWDYIEKYCIEFRDENELAKNPELISFDEAKAAAEKTVELIIKTADPTVKEILGPEFEIDVPHCEFKFADSKAWLYLKQDGTSFSIPGEAIDFVDPQAQGSFETIRLFHGPVVWHPESYGGDYVLDPICTDEETCKNMISGSVKPFLESALPYIQKLTL